MNDFELYAAFQKSPIFFIEKMWGIVPERDNEKFVKGQHMSWQQHDILLAIEKGLKGEAPRKIAIKSGNGIGKDTTVSWLIIWFLFCFKNAQVPCTANTSSQLKDVLWKEVSLWMSKMPEAIQSLYEVTDGYIRIKESPETWFARARTAGKDNPEAMSGIHADYVMGIVEEASGVFEEVFVMSEGVFTAPNVFFILISNPTRLIGRFYDVFHTKREGWQLLTFSSDDSPLVSKDFIKEKAREGLESDDYRVFVAGEFPKSDAVDDLGYVPLLLESDLKYCEDGPMSVLFVGDRRMGIDPSGEGSDESSWVSRDTFKAKISASEKISTSRSIADKSLRLMLATATPGDGVTIDNFGVGANVARDMAIASDYGNPRINAVNVGEKADDSERFINKRAEAYFRLKEWVRSGGELVRDKRWRELLNIRYKRDLSGRFKIMSKDEMRKAGIPSPNHADALMLTFVEEEKVINSSKQFVPKHNVRR